MRRQQAGLTLVEVLAVVVLMTILYAAAAQALSAGIRYDERLASSDARDRSSETFESAVRSLLLRAYLTPNATSETTYFVASSGLINQGDGTGDPDTLTFSVTGSRLSASVLDRNLTFESANESIGPRGGVAEVGISPSATGQPSGAATGAVYLRTQRPGDGDPTQGGTESTLASNVTGLRFEFYDGSTWISTWDTRTQTTKRLPAAVRVSYTSDEAAERTFTVKLAASDVTRDNPITEGG